jgi:hypothetical protein
MEKILATYLKYSNDGMDSDIAILSGCKFSLFTI